MTTRRQQAYALREAAAKHAYDRPHPTHHANGDEQSAWEYAFNFTKGLDHDPVTGLVQQAADYEQFVASIHSGDPRDFEALRTGEAGTGGLPWRAWESQGAGHVFDMEGPDAQAVTMPQAPNALSDEMTGEMGEVYAQAILRDQPLSELRHDANEALVDDVIGELNALPWFQDDASPGNPSGRHRGQQDRQTAFRGLAPGDSVGPYLSQFLLVGTAGVDGARDARDGRIQYGAQTIDQRVHIAQPHEDYLASWNEWLAVQNGANPGRENYCEGSRFIATGRDLATFVHYDALYQAYLNACLIMLDRPNPKFDPGIPFQLEDLIDKQQGFAHFGPPHILTLVTEVATRALKAVRYQKFNVHRRSRPEVMGARYEKADDLSLPGLADARDAINASGIGGQIVAMNNPGTLLLPMAFPEGSPMHPSYGAGHATVAGACVTILKAFFDVSQPLGINGNAGRAYVPDQNGENLQEVDVLDAAGNPAELTLEGELNKLAANISIGRDWAGVHYFSDYWESLKMGEQIAIGILEEQRLCYQENVTMTIPLFEGGTVQI